VSRSDDACPAEGDLAAFAAGRLPLPALDAVAAHVEACAACQAALEGLEGQVDPVEAALRRGRPVETLPPGRTDGPGWSGTQPPTPRLVRPAPRLESEVRDLLRRRLSVVSALIAFVFVAVLALSLLSEAGRRTGVGWAYQALRAAGALFAAGICVALRLRPTISSRGLRRLDLGLMAAVAAILMLNHHRLLVTTPVGGFEGPRHSDSYLIALNALCVTAWSMLIVGYGVLIPNTGRRAAAVVGVLTAVPCLLIVVDSLRSARVRENRVVLLAWSGTILAVADGLATYGSSRISALQRAAFEARRLGPYQLKRLLGAGGMGEVYLAEHRLLKRPCAVKLIRPERAGDPGLLRRFQREVRATSRLTHFNTVEVFDFGLTEGGTFYYVMEYLPGLNLAELVARHGPLPPARTVYLARQVCGALREAHDAGLVHRDIKPGNVIVGRFGGRHDVAKLLDFGLVRSLDGGGPQSRLTHEGALLGTPDYMAPEQAFGGVVDARSDLYSLGALLYYLLAGRPPFLGATVMDVLDAHRHRRVPPLAGLAPGVPDDLEAVVLRCLAKDPAARLPDAASLDRALASCRCPGPWGEEQAEAWWRAHGVADGPSGDTGPLDGPEKT
jgi:eukaryotic-like serine/threonine-protein kinase